MDAPVEKTSIAEQRAQKKAARRAAFIQDIAKAVVIAHQTGQYADEAEQALAERLAATPRLGHQ